MTRPLWERGRVLAEAMKRVRHHIALMVAVAAGGVYFFPTDGSVGEQMAVLSLVLAGLMIAGSLGVQGAE